MGMNQDLYVENKKTGDRILHLRWKKGYDIHRWMFNHVEKDLLGFTEDYTCGQGQFELTRDELLEFIKYCKWSLDPPQDADIICPDLHKEYCEYALKEMKGSFDKMSSFGRDDDYVIIYEAI
jgi:hypothetical protein